MPWPNNPMSPPPGVPVGTAQPPGLASWLQQYGQTGGAGMAPWGGGGAPGVPVTTTDAAGPVVPVTTTQPQSTQQGSAKPSPFGPMPPQNAFPGGSSTFDEAAGPGLPSWAGGPQQGGAPPNLPPGYIYAPNVTGGIVQSSPFTGFGAMQGPTPYQPGVPPNGGAGMVGPPAQQPGGGISVGPGFTPPAGTGPGPMTATTNGAGGFTVGHGGATSPGGWTPTGQTFEVDTSNPYGPGMATSTMAIPGGGGGPSTNQAPVGSTPWWNPMPGQGGPAGGQSGAGGMSGGIYYPPGSGGSSSSSGGYNGGSGTPYGINPADIANPNPQNFGNWQEFEDNAYAGFVRQLDPQWAERERQLGQELNNRGIPPGSEAWTQAMADFNQGRNDAYGQARQQAQQAGLAAQNQAFGQNAIESQLANALLRSQWDMDTRMAGIGAQNNATNAQLQQALASLGLQRDLGFGNMGLQRELGLYGVGLDYDRLGFAQDQAGFGNLMQMLQFGFGANQYNNQLLNDDYGRGMGLFGMVPQVSPGQVDVTGPYGNAQNWAGFLQGNANQQQNGFYQGLGSLFQTLPFLFGQGGNSGGLPQTFQPYGPQSGGYGYPSGGFNGNLPWTQGMNYWPGG